MKKITANEKKLSPRALNYWNMIKAQSGVPMWVGLPGFSKSATARYIADTLKLQYIEIRLSTIDETDLGIFPVVSEVTQGDKMYKVIDQAIPSWAIEANSMPTLIHFEELNRCNQNIRNACLGILLEKVIGTKFTFNENVYFIASGNPNTEYDNDIFTLGSALINRLIPIEFKLELEDWKTEFANVNGRIMPEIVNFLTQNPLWFGNDLNETISTIMNTVVSSQYPKQYPTARSWTFLSDYLKALQANYPEMYTDVIEGKKTNIIASYVGDKVSLEFISWMEKNKKLNIETIMNSDVLPTLENDTVKQNLLTEFGEKYKFMNDLTAKQCINFKNFFEVCTDEQKYAFLMKLSDDIPNEVYNPEVEDPKYKNTIDFFKSYKAWLAELCLKMEVKPTEATEATEDSTK